MRRALLVATLATAGLALSPGNADAWRRSWDGAAGRLDPLDGEIGAVGRFRMIQRFHGASSTEEFILEARGLDATPDESGQRPIYDAFAITGTPPVFPPPPPGLEVYFGALRPTSKGVSRLRIPRSRDLLPEVLDSLADFEWGTVELRRGAAVVLSGGIGSFHSGQHRYPPQGDEHGSGRLLLGKSRMLVTEAGGDARGVVTASYKYRPGGDHHAIHVRCENLGEPGDTFDVIAYDGEGNSMILGTAVPTRSYFGDGRSHRFDSVLRFFFTTRADIVPPEGLRFMAGWSIEVVRNTTGEPWLVGTIPSIPGAR